MRTLATAATTLVLAVTLAACGSANGGGDAAQFKSPNDLRLKLTDMVGSSCGSAETDVTQGSSITCEWNGKQVLLSTYPSEKQAQSGAEYLTGMGTWTVKQEGSWLIAVTGDQPDLDALVAKVNA